MGSLNKIADIFGGNQETLTVYAAKVTGPGAVMSKSEQCISLINCGLLAVIVLAW
jgi:hypothetical protein